MYEDFTRNRISQLRTQKDVSARDMSLTLGQNGSYINQIENGKALPSLQGLFFICEYFGITPMEFFDDRISYPAEMKKLIGYLNRVDPVTLEHITEIVKDILGER